MRISDWSSDVCSSDLDHLKSILAPLRQRIIAIPGNHDGRDSMRAAFAAEGYLPDRGFLQFAIDDAYPLRLVGLDTVIPGEGGGELCAERLDRSEERRVGKEGGSTCSSRWSSVP